MRRANLLWKHVILKRLFWQNANERIEVYGGRALLEDSWLFCTHGRGFITIDAHRRKVLGRAAGQHSFMEWLLYAPLEIRRQ